MSIHTTSRARHAGRAFTAIAAAFVLIPAAASAQTVPATNGAIVYERSSAIVSIASGGGAITPLTGGIYAHHPAVSPDGSMVAYVNNSNIWTMRRDGSDKRAVTTDGLINDDPTWSPDGTQIAFSRKQSTRPDIFVVAASGGTVRNLTASPDNEETNPAWSPDGRQIAYQRSGCEIPRGGGTCVYVMNTDGSAQTNLTWENRVAGCESYPGYRFNGASREPAWSPDSTKIAFAGPLICRVGTSGSDIWIMSRNGAGKTNINRDHGTADGMPEFSPDGTRIVFARPGIGIFTMAATGGTLQQITSGGFDYHPDWEAAR